MISTKNAAIGGGVVLGGVGTGVAVNYAIKDEKETEIEIKLKEAKFEINKEDKDCLAKLKETYSKDNYKKAAVSCSKDKNFKQRAKDLGINLLETSKIDTESESGSWKTKWDAKNTEIKALSTDSSGWTKASNAKAKIIETCDTNITFSESATNSKWHTFLTVCAKEDSSTTPATTKLADALKKDFWTNETTARAKLKNLGFEVNESEVGCKNKLDENGFDLRAIVEVCYKSKKFSDRAKAMNLDVIETTINDLDNGGWDVAWNLHKTTMTTLITGAEKKDWTAAKNEVKTYCTTDTQGNKTITKDSKNEDWKNFIKVCAKDKAAKNGTKAKVEAEDFWTTSEINW